MKALLLLYHYRRLYMYSNKFVSSQSSKGGFVGFADSTD